MANPQARPLPRVVIVGGGFAGLTAAKALRRAPVDLTLLDRRNHHLFQPLLYQVATAMLSPANIAAPIRKVLSRQKNARVLLAEVTGVDPGRGRVLLADGEIAFDYLILATGATHSYFGRDDWRAFAPGLKSVEDAIEIRRRFLLAFEAAERETDPPARRAKLTFIVVGGGPTGVETAGAMIEIARRGIPRDFRAIDTTTARVLLVEALDRILPTFPAAMSARAAKDLKTLGVEVRTGSRVTEIDGRGVRIGTERIDAGNVIWAAGVKASPLGALLGAPTDRAGRVQVELDLSVPGHSNIFVLGDLAKVTDGRSGQDVPGISPAAMQMGRYAGRIIAAEARAGATGQPVPARGPFRYRDKGMLATIGRSRAVATIRGFNFAGFVAWLLWAGVHIFYLIEFRNRLIVMMEWAWAYLTFQRGARLITGDQPPLNPPSPAPGPPPPGG